MFEIFYITILEYGLIYKSQYIKKEDCSMLNHYTVLDSRQWVEIEICPNGVFFGVRKKLNAIENIALFVKSISTAFLHILYFYPMYITFHSKMFRRNSKILIPHGVM